MYKDILFTPVFGSLPV